MFEVAAFAPMQLFFAFSYHLHQRQVRFSGQRPGRKLPLAGDYPWGGGLEDTTGSFRGLGGHSRGPWRDLVNLSMKLDFAEPLTRLIRQACL